MIRELRLVIRTGINNSCLPQPVLDIKVVKNVLQINAKKIAVLCELITIQYILTLWKDTNMFTHISDIACSQSQKGKQKNYNNNN